MGFGIGWISNPIYIIMWLIVLIVGIVEGIPLLIKLSIWAEVGLAFLMFHAIYF